MMAGTNKSDDVVVDVADVSPRHVVSNGKKLRALPFANATTVIVRSQDFKQAGNIDHADVEWDFRVDDFTVAVGKGISQEAADFLVNKYPDSFAYVEG
jgi:hypothetical protein